MKLNFDNCEFYSSPFPFLIINDFLDEDSWSSLVDEFPNNADEFQNVMGGRLRLSSEEQEFYEFIESSEAWAAFYKKINSRRFVQGILETFKESIDVYRPVGNFEEYHFDKEFLFNQLSENISRLNRIRRSQVHNVSSKDLALVILHRIKARLLNFQDGRSNSKQEMYLHMDISEAGVGYKREIHHDNDNRIAAFVYYLNDKGSMKGGEFEIHQYSNGRPLAECPPHPDPKDMELSHSFQPTANTMILFLSSPNSYHSVPVVTQAIKPRRFVYGGLTTKEPFAWRGAIRSKK